MKTFYEVWVSDIEIGFHPERKYYMDRGKAINEAKRLASLYNCGKLEDVACGCGVHLWAQDNPKYWVGVDERYFED